MLKPDRGDCSKYYNYKKVRGMTTSCCAAMSRKVSTLRGIAPTYTFMMNTWITLPESYKQRVYKYPHAAVNHQIRRMENPMPAVVISVDAACVDIAILPDYLTSKVRLEEPEIRSTDTNILIHNNCMYNQLDFGMTGSSRNYEDEGDKSDEWDFIPTASHTRNNDLTRWVTHREALCGPEIHIIFGAEHYQVLWTCAWTPIVLYQLNVMTRNCARFCEVWESRRPDACRQFFSTCNTMEHGRAGGMIPLVKKFLHMELWIAGEPGLRALVTHYPPITLWITGEPELVVADEYFRHIELWIVGESEACYLCQDLYGSSNETREGQRYRTPDTLWKPYLVLLCIVNLLLNLLFLLFCVLFVLINTGNSVPTVFLWPSSIIVSLDVSFSFWWFGQETIEHD